MQKLVVLAITTAVLFSGGNVNAAQGDVQPLGLVRNAGQWPQNVIACSHTQGVDVWITSTGVIVDEYTADGDWRTGTVIEEYFAGATVIETPVPSDASTLTFFRNGSNTPLIATASRSDAVAFQFESGAVLNLSVSDDGRVMRSLRKGDEHLASTVAILRRGDVGQSTMDATRAGSFVYGSYLGGAQFSRSGPPSDGEGSPRKKMSTRPDRRPAGAGFLRSPPWSDPVRGPFERAGRHGSTCPAR